MTDTQPNNKRSKPDDEEDNPPELFEKSPLDCPMDDLHVAEFPLSDIVDRQQYPSLVTKWTKWIEEDKEMWLHVTAHGTYKVRSIEDINHVLESLMRQLIRIPALKRGVVYVKE